MKTILVDDEPLALELFSMECRGMDDVEIVGQFTDPTKALEFAQSNWIEFAVLDVEMAGMNGLDLGRKLKELYPELVLVYVTGYSEYVVATMKLKADYCIVKPYNHDDVEDLVKRAKLLSKRQRKRIRVEMFGRFNVFADGRLLQIPNAKAKELLALCMDHRGGVVTMEEAIDKLWPNRDYDERVKRLYRKAIMSIQSTLKETGCGDLFDNGRGSCHIRPELVECDYYRYLEDPEGKAELFNGEYLFEYEWGEETLARLTLTVSRVAQR